MTFKCLKIMRMDIIFKMFSVDCDYYFGPKIQFWNPGAIPIHTPCQGGLENSHKVNQI